MKHCEWCNNQFEATVRDRAFYQKINVPEPKLCPDCRQQRRLMFRNERTLYSRSCDLCKKSIVSIYPSQTPFPVYCQTCWWSDSWEGTQYGIDYDPQRSFFDQYKELQGRVPHVGINAFTSENSDYTNNAVDNKNCYLLFAAENNEDCYYGRLVQTCKDCVDCDYIYDSQRCYGSLDCRNCYNTHFSEKSQGCNDVLFGFNLSGCSNCILCTNLRSKEYHVENKPVSKEEYERRRAEILASRESIASARMRFDELKKQAIVKYADLLKCENSTGDYLFNCQDTIRSFDTTNAKECAYVNDALDPIDFYDGNNVYYKPELCYEIMGVLKIYNCQCNTYIFYCANVLYSDSCHNTNDSIGCIGLRKNQWCILNKQYSPEEYERLKNEIVERLRAEGLYGEFFPPELSPFAYNETHAMTYYPLTKDEAISKGWRWSDTMPSTTGKETMNIDSIPAIIENTADDITRAILACAHCGKNYKITAQELSFYRTHHLPIPIIAPECRLLERQSRRKPRKLWTRSCMCRGAESHDHGASQCSRTFETPYAPERQEVVYCEHCYLQEVI